MCACHHVSDPMRPSVDSSFMNMGPLCQADRQACTHGDSQLPFAITDEQVYRQQHAQSVAGTKMTNCSGQ